MCFSNPSLMLLPSASLISGFAESSLMGKSIVMIQLAISVLGFAIVIGKLIELKSITVAGRNFLRNFLQGRDVLDYYLSRRQGDKVTLERIYDSTCERMVKLFDTEMRHLLLGSQQSANISAALTQREIELIRGTCERVLQDETLRIEHGMSLLATLVATAPTIGLLGTVWGVLDAFAFMGGKGVVLLSEIAPAISSALVTTVVALLIAIPGSVAYNHLGTKLRQVAADMEGFADELMGRIACEYQGGGI